MLLMNEIAFHLSKMGSKVYLVEHLKADELYHRYRAEQDPIISIPWPISIRSWESGAVISPTIRTGSSPPPSSIGGRLSSKTLPLEAFTRRWYNNAYAIIASDLKPPFVHL
jgi:hypothetical protein